MNTRKPYLFSASRTLEVCGNHFTNGTCIENRTFTEGEAQYEDTTGDGFAYDLPYSINVSMTVTSDDDTGLFILDKYRQKRSIKIPSTSFCWPMVGSSEKATLFENLNSFETVTEINSVFYYDQAYTST